MLQLLLENDRSRRAPTIILQLAWSVVDPLIQAVFLSAPRGRRLLLPAPGPEAAATSVRDWCHDTWFALSKNERRSVRVIAGVGAAGMLPLLEEESAVYALIRDPLEPVRAAEVAGAALPTRSQQDVFKEGADRRRQDYFRPIANTQSRALLLGTPAADDLPVTLGPPSDAEDWRRLLFSGTASRTRLVTEKGLSKVAAKLAEDLEYLPETLSQALKNARGRRAKAETSERGGLKNVKSLRALNWLDVELFEHVLQQAR
jgi:hypothetical protein